MEVILGAFSEYDAEILVSLKKDTMDRKPLSRLLKPGVRIEPWTDQWGALKDADLFVTHHGLNSTHEAIYHGIPMLSCPIFSDQPAMARRCQDFGLALPLTESVEEQLDPVKVQSVINEALENYDSINTRLAEARSWEITVMADRDRVLDRMLNLI